MNKLLLSNETISIAVRDSFKFIIFLGVKFVLTKLLIQLFIKSIIRPFRMCCTKYFTKSFLYYQQGNKSVSNISDYTQSNPVALVLISCLINCLVKRTGITKHLLICLRYMDKLLGEATMLFLILHFFLWVSTRKGNIFSQTCSREFLQISPFLEVYCGFKVIQLCSCSTQLSMKFYLVINSKLQISTAVSCSV